MEIISKAVDRICIHCNLITGKQLWKATVTNLEDMFVNIMVPPRKGSSDKITSVERTYR